MTTTLATIIRKQVRQLRSEALSAGDDRLVATCDIALASQVVCPVNAELKPQPYVVPSGSAFAWIDCVNAIRAAEDQH